MVEMAFVTILLALLACGVADLGRAIFTNIGIQDAAQEGVRYAAYESGVTVDAVAARTREATQYPNLAPENVSVCTTATSVTVEVTKTVSFLTPLLGRLLGGSIELGHAYTSDFFNTNPLEATC